MRDSRIKTIIQEENKHLFDYLDDWAIGSVHVVKGVSIFVLVSYFIYQCIHFGWYGTLDFSLYYFIPIIVYFSAGFFFEFLFEKGYAEFVGTRALVIMHILMVALAFWLDCFTDSSICQIYVPLILAVGPIMFLYSVLAEIFINTSTLILYLIAASFNMTPITPVHAVIQAVLTYLLGMMSVLIIANMRYAVRQTTNVLNKEKETRKKIEYASEVAEALSYDFLNVYSIDFENKTCRIIKLDGYVTDGFDNNDKQTDYSYEKMIETYINNRVHPDEREKLKRKLTIDHVQKMLEDNKAYIEPYRILDDHGEHYCQFRFVRIGTSGKIIAGFRNVDTTMRYDQEQRIALREALFASQQASKAKTTFLNNISHDIRTPMNAILGYRSHAQAHLDDPQIVKDSLNQINESSQQLLKYIDNILDASRINTQIDYAVEPYSLKELSKELFDEINLIAKPKNITLTYDDSRVVNDIVKTNKERFHQVMYAVLENAVLYTPAGGNVSFTISQGSKVGSEKHRYVFTVKDNGVGMSEDFLRHLFDPFSREKDTTHSGIAGAGLGLLTAKNILESTGGGIVVQSQQDKGTEVTMIAMLYCAEEKGARSNSTEDFLENNNDTICLKGMRVLVVDDNELNQEIAINILSLQGILADGASSGQEAIQMFQDSSLGFYKAILMDILMPEMDGFETTKAIRNLERIDAKNIPIIALSANTNSIDSDKALSQGMNAFLAKPFQAEDFLRVMEKIYKQ